MLLWSRLISLGVALGLGLFAWFFYENVFQFPSVLSYISAVPLTLLSVAGVLTFILTFGFRVRDTGVVIPKENSWLARKAVGIAPGLSEGLHFCNLYTTCAGFVFLWSVIIAFFGAIGFLLFGIALLMGEKILERDMWEGVLLLLGFIGSLVGIGTFLIFLFGYWLIRGKDEGVLGFVLWSARILVASLFVVAVGFGAYTLFNTSLPWFDWNDIKDALTLYGHTFEKSLRLYAITAAAAFGAIPLCILARWAVNRYLPRDLSAKICPVVKADV